MTLGDLLRPRPADVHGIVLREMDPTQSRAFEQLCFGPVVNALLLTSIALSAAVITPYRIAWRLLSVWRG